MERSIICGYPVEKSKYLLITPGLVVDEITYYGDKKANIVDNPKMVSL